ncbi:hypothetical protein ACLRAD_11290 [Gallibacterium anatis]|uniref:hypothetical protein n=1 Tax=Gallibacterium anatis TaxID=750 RepID=UPI0039FDBD63
MIIMKIDTCIKQSDVTQVRSTLLQMLALARQKELSHEDLMRFESLFGEVDDLLITLANELYVQQEKD